MTKRYRVTQYAHWKNLYGDRGIEEMCSKEYRYLWYARWIAWLYKGNPSSWGNWDIEYMSTTLIDQKYGVST